MRRNAQIFLCYARQDYDVVKGLYEKLLDAGFKPWMDKSDIVGGEKWQPAIHGAIQKSDLFVACLSRNSVNKRGFLQREIRIALDILQELLDADIYIIPLRLEECDVPENLKLFQWVDYYREDGWTRLIQSIHKGIARFGVLRHAKLRARPFLGLSLADAKALVREKNFNCTEFNKNSKMLDYFYEPKYKPIGHDEIIYVEDGTGETHYNDDEEMIFHDITTDLMWQRSGSETDMSFGDAERYIYNLNLQKFAGSDDWRLPTLEEAMSLMEPIQSSFSGLYINPMFSRIQRDIWTSDKESPDRAWSVSFRSGTFFNLINDSKNFVRAVRSQQ